MKPQKITSEDYLTRIQKLRINPNFFVSAPYIDLNELVVETDGYWVWVRDEEWTVFPPVHTTNRIPEHKPVMNKIWCDYEEPSWGGVPEFLDWEYIFNQSNFLKLQGGKWNTFRKNIRKWPRENPKYVYTDTLVFQTALNHLVVDWFDPRAEAVEDSEFIVKFAMHPHTGIRRKYMYTRNWELVGMNAWDWNHNYINYRLCVVKTGERFLDEFMRYSFYTDTEILYDYRLVNDGGTLGRAGLEIFKDKMNPMIKRKRYSLHNKKP